MANRQLSALTDAAALNALDLLLVTQGGNSRKATAQQIVDLTQKAEERVLADLGPLGKAIYKATPALVDLNAATATVVGLIPQRSIILAVTTFVRSALTGTLTSISVGDSGDPSRFGGSLGKGAGSNNVGVVGPFAVYSPHDIIVTANGGTATGNTGKIRVVAHYITFNSPLD